jgi:hypothetical protein
LPESEYVNSLRGVLVEVKEFGAELRPQRLGKFASGCSALPALNLHLLKREGCKLGIQTNDFESLSISCKALVWNQLC